MFLFWFKKGSILFLELRTILYLKLKNKPLSAFTDNNLPSQGFCCLFTLCSYMIIHPTTESLLVDGILAVWLHPHSHNFSELWHS